MAERTLLESILQREKAILIGCLFFVILISWIYLLTGAGMDMDILKMTFSGMDMGSKKMDMDMDMPTVWNSQYIALMFVMWWVMMIAMMLPSAAPTILLHGQVIRKNYSNQKFLLPTLIFTFGYLIAWGVFSLIAPYSQWGLDSIGWLSKMMASNNVILGSGILITAGIYQLTPFKHACLDHCKNPTRFLTEHWRSGNIGSFRMGLYHGIYCLGCCWFLMALLFVGGVMNLFWIAGLAIFVLLEKTIPAGKWLSTISGIFLIVWGSWIILAHYLI